MLDPALRDQLATYLGRLTKTVQITSFVDDSAASSEQRAFLLDIAGTSPHVEVREVRSVAERTPSFGIHLPGEAIRVHFAGLPLGHELTSLVLALLHVGGHPPRVEPEILARIDRLEGDLRFETWFSTSCQSCPDVVQALNLIASRRPGVVHTAIDGASHREEAQARQVFAVPSVFLNGQPFAQGRMQLEDILAQLEGDDAHAERAKALDDRAPVDVLVIGGGPAGAAAAVYAARKGIDVGLVAERFGGQVLDTLAIENFVSVIETQGPSLAAALEAHVRAYPVEVIERQRVASITVADPFEVTLESGARLRAQSLILATGAQWRNMNVPGEAEHRARGVTYCPHCDGPLFAGKRVAVIGGGNSGVEAAIDLAGIVAHVTLLELQPSLRADAVLTRKLASLPNAEVITSARTTRVQGDGKRVTGLDYEDVVSGQARHLAVDGIFVQIGLVPNTAFLRGVVDLSPQGEVIVDARGQTSVPGIFAAGDMTTAPFKQIVCAAGDGAKAALGAFDHLIRATAPAERKRPAASSDRAAASP